MQFSFEIPGYTSTGYGISILLSIYASLSDKFELSTSGNVALALASNFKRVVGIISSQDVSWKHINKIHYHLECSNNRFKVMDSKSSSMAISIALFNINRLLKGKTLIEGITGTGILRIDGSFEKAHLENSKKAITKDGLFISSENCKNLFELEKLINFYSKRS